MFTNTSAAQLIANEDKKQNGNSIDPAGQMCQCSLKTARDAIARWTRGSVKAVRPDGQRHVSAQQRWLAQAQRDLSAWISEGGFGQPRESAPPAPASCAGMLAPTMYTLSSQVCTGVAEDKADACME